MRGGACMDYYCQVCSLPLSQAAYTEYKNDTEKVVVVKGTKWLEDVTLNYKGHMVKLKGSDCHDFYIKSLPKELKTEEDFMDRVNDNGAGKQYISLYDFDLEDDAHPGVDGCTIMHTACINRTDKGKIERVRPRLRELHDQMFNVAKILGIKSEYDDNAGKKDYTDLKWVLTEPAASTVKPPKPQPAPGQIDSLTLVDLKKVCDILGVKKVGNKTDVIKSIQIFVCNSKQ